MIKIKETETITLRRQWQMANEEAINIGNEIFASGSGYGCDEAKEQDLHRLNQARHIAENLFTQYLEAERKEYDSRILKLQQSQNRATWASFILAAIIGVSTIITSWLALNKN